MSSMHIRRVPSGLVGLMVAGALLLAACAPARPVAEPEARPAAAGHPGQVADTLRLPQQAGAYTARLAPDEPLVSPETQAAWTRQLTQAHFAPWYRQAPAFGRDQVFWAHASFAGKTLYGQNMLPRPNGWLDARMDEAAPGSWPSLKLRAVSVASAAMRALPTDEPVFYDFALPGEGFPFDYNQNSLVPAGTPLLATHSSADGAWLLVESRYAAGWMRVADVAFVDDEFAREYEAGALCCLTRDGAPLAVAAGQPGPVLLTAFTSRVGMLLPLSRREGDTFWLRVPLRGADGRAVLAEAPLPRGTAEAVPMSATPRVCAALLDAMLGAPYGWGGLYGQRDCSALIQDYLACLGLAMPRNSGEQAAMGRRLPFADLDGPAREALLLGEGTPFLTLLAKPGHVMLYIGSDPDTGRPVVMHALWGLKTRPDGPGGREGRFIIGRAAITTLTPGVERPELERPKGLLLETLSGAALLAP